MNGFDISVSISAVTVFLQGILSFFSPCVLPLVPLYMGYLSGGIRRAEEDGSIHYNRKKVLVNTFFFVLGVSFAFFLLGLGVTAAGQFFSKYQHVITVIGGILIVFFGLYQLGVFGQSTLLAAEHRLPFHLDRLAMSPLTAVVFGFTFSFAWTPCVGPALTSVLLMAGSSDTAAQGFFLIGVYTLGFVIPFLLVGLFTSSLLDLFRKYRGVVQYTVKIGAVLMIVMGILMATGLLTRMSAAFSALGTPAAAQSQTQTDKQDAVSEDTQTEEKQEEAESLPPATDFTLYDQYGNAHQLSDYAGKTVFLNFWATWCPPCLMEMPDIQRLYEEWGENTGDLIVLGVANPVSDQYPRNTDVSQEEIVAFLKENGYTYPVLMDVDGSVFSAYGIRSLPTTFMISDQSEVFGYIQGSLSRDMMDSIIEQTMTGVRK